MDTLMHGRTKGGAWERHRNVKLTASQIELIRARRKNAETCANLGREYGVGRDQVSRICNNILWREESIRRLDRVNAG